MVSLMIADDERITQKTLKLLIEKNFPDIDIVAIACNGIELVAMVQQYKPDIAIVDITMPGMSGLDAIELLHDKQFKTKFVINTAYGEFEFAKKAVGLKVEAYILKPEYQDQTIETIRRLKESVYEEQSQQASQQRLHKTMQHMEYVLENEIMSSIFLNTPDEESFRQYCEIHGIEFGTGTVVSMPSFLIGKQKFYQADMVQIRKSLNRILSNCCNYLCNINANNLCLFIFLQDDISKNWNVWLEELMSVVLENLRKDFGIVLKVGVGRIYRKFDDMAKAYHESLIALEDKKQCRICFYQERTEAERSIAGSSTAKNPIQNPDLIYKNPDNIYVSYAMKYIDTMYSKSLSLEEVADEIGVSSYYLSRLFKQELGLTFVEYLTNVRMKNAISFIKNTKMPLSEIANKVGYNSTTYFTRVLKKYTGKKMTDIRMETRIKNLN